MKQSEIFFLAQFWFLLNMRSIRDMIPNPLLLFRFSVCPFTISFIMIDSIFFRVTRGKTEVKAMVLERMTLWADKYFEVDVALFATVQDTTIIHYDELYADSAKTLITRRHEAQSNFQSGIQFRGYWNSFFFALKIGRAFIYGNRRKAQTLIAGICIRKKGSARCPAQCTKSIKHSCSRILIYHRVMELATKVTTKKFPLR